jgi:predicted amidohydrolase
VNTTITSPPTSLLQIAGTLSEPRASASGFLHFSITAIAVAFLGIVLPASASAPPNLIPQSPEAWKTWSPRPDLAPKADITSRGGTPLLSLRATRFASYGKWIANVPGVRGGQDYRFEVSYRPQDIVSDDVSVAIILSWKSADGKPVQRDYVDEVSTEADGWRLATRTLPAPPKAASLEVELVLRWTDSGSVTWKQPRLFETAAPSHRKVKVVTTRIQPGPHPTVEKNLALMSATFDRAAAEKPDLVLFTENLVDRGTQLPVTRTAQPIPGPATQMLSEKARQYKTWVATSMHESDGGLIYNTAVLIDREGRIAGKYRKVHLAMAEAEAGITPGSSYPVFNTDFGRVGMMVCWDDWFGETARILRLKGAEVLLLPIAGDGVPDHWDVISRARAIDNGVFLIASSTQAQSPSRIIDPNGRVLAETADGIASAEIDIDQHTRVYWLSVGAADGEGKSIYIKERRPDTYGAIAPGGDQPRH